MCPSGINHQCDDEGNFNYEDVLTSIHLAYSDILVYRSGKAGLIAQPVTP